MFLFYGALNSRLNVRLEMDGGSGCNQVLLRLRVHISETINDVEWLCSWQTPMNCHSIRRAEVLHVREQSGEQSSMIKADMQRVSNGLILTHTVVATETASGAPRGRLKLRACSDTQRIQLPSVLCVNRVSQRGAHS